MPFSFVIACGPVTERCSKIVDAISLAKTYAKESGLPATVAHIGYGGEVETVFVAYADGETWEPSAKE